MTPSFRRRNAWDDCWCVTAQPWPGQLRMSRASHCGCLTDSTTDSEGWPGSMKIPRPRRDQCPDLTTYLDIQIWCTCRGRDASDKCREKCHDVERLQKTACLVSLYERTENRLGMTTVSPLSKLPVRVRHAQAIQRSVDWWPWSESCNNKCCLADRFARLSNF